MTLFYGIRANARKAQAAVLVQNLLDMAARIFGPFDAPTSLMANKLVGLMWERNPDKFGPTLPLPNKYVLAACALSSGVHAAEKMDNPQLLQASRFALAEVCKVILVQCSQGGHGMSAWDVGLFDDVLAHLMHISAEQEKGPYASSFEAPGT